MDDKLEILHQSQKREIAKVEIGDTIQLLFQTVGKLSQSAVYLIGSSVRRYLTGEENEFNDFDFVGVYDFDAIEASPLCKVISRHDKYGVMKVSIAGCEIDLINGTSIIEALKERDITLSLFCLDSTGSIYDPLGYIEDIQNRVIRIEDAERKIALQPVRILRVLRFAIELGYEIEEETLNACRAYAGQIKVGKAKFEIPKIRKLDPSQRKALIELAYSLGIGEEIMSLFRSKGAELVSSNQELSVYIAKLKELLGFDNFYVFGGSLRDAVFERKIGDIDVRLKMTADDFTRLLGERGYIETNDFHLPEGTFFYNRRFNAISVRLDGMVCDFTFLHDIDLEQWYRNCDVNCNALMMDAQSGTILNGHLLDKILLGLLELCDIEQAKLDPLKFINFLKLVSKSKGFILDSSSINALRENMSLIFQYFRANSQMLYRLKSIMGRENSAEAIDIIRSIPEGQSLLGLMEG